MSTRRWQAGRLIRRTGGKSPLSKRIRPNLQLQRLKHKKRVGQHDQSQMPVQSRPTATLKLVQTTLTFGILIELLDGPTQVGQFHQARQRRLGGQIAHKPLGIALLSSKGTLCQQPDFRAGPTAPVALTVASAASACMNPKRDKTPTEGSLTTLSPLDRLPGILRQCIRHGFDIMTGSRTWFLGLTSLPGGRSGLLDA